MRIPLKSVIALFVAAAIGAAITYVVLMLVPGAALHCKPASSPVDQPAAQSEVAPVAATVDIDQLLKDLRTRFINDPRSIAEKLDDFFAQDHNQKNIAIASKVIVDMAENREMLADADIEYLYQHHSDLTLKRVLAQVLSLRGDNRLLELYIAHLQKSLHKSEPPAQQKTLIELAKTHYQGAVIVIKPLLHSDDTGVLLDALLALRATGNESDIHYAEALKDHPDQSVSWLANDVINQLQYLSKKARTGLILADVIAELPPINNE